MDIVWAVVMMVGGSLLLVTWAIYISTGKRKEKWDWMGFYKGDKKDKDKKG